MRKSKSVVARMRQRVGNLLDSVPDHRKVARRVRNALRKFPRIG